MKIPIYQRRESIPDTAGGVLQREIIPVGAAISTVGNIIADLGFNQEEHNALMQKQDEDNKIANLAVQFDNNLTTDYIEYHQQRGDKAYGSQERLGAFQQLQIESLTKDIDNPRVLKNITAYIQNQVNGRRIDYANHEARQRQEVSTITRDLKLDTVSQSAFNGIGTLDENIENVRNFIKTQHDNIELGTDMATEWLLNAERQVAERTIAGMINRTPTAAIEIMAAGAFNKYLDSKTIEHYTNEARQEASRLVKIQEATIKKQQEERESVANKELSDALLNGNLTTDILGKHRDSLTQEQYKSWVKEYDSQINNLKKSIDEEKAKSVEADLFVKAITNNELSTTQGGEAFKNEIAGKVARRELDPSKARQLLNDASELENGNPERREAIRTSIQSIDTAYKNGILGEGIESTIERERMIRDLRTWSIQNPDKNPDEFTEKVLTAKKESWIKMLFRQLPGISLFTSPPLPGKNLTPQEARQAIMAKPILPTKDELRSIIKENKFKKQSELIQYLKTTYSISQEEALNYYKGLK